MGFSGLGGPTPEVAKDNSRPPRQQLSVPRRCGNSLQTAPVARAASSYGEGCGRRRRGGFLALPVLAAVALCTTGVGAVSVPEAPARVDLDVMSGEEVTVSFAAPLSDGGSAVQSYEVCGAGCWANRIVCNVRGMTTTPGFETCAIICHKTF